MFNLLKISFLFIFFHFYLWVKDISVNITQSDMKFIRDDGDIALEGTISQISYLGLLFHLKKGKLILQF